MATREQIKKINKELVKFMFQTNKKIQILQKKYYKILGQYPGVLSNAGFNSGEINFYRLNKNLRKKKK